MGKKIVLVVFFYCNNLYKVGIEIIKKTISSEKSFGITSFGWIPILIRLAAEVNFIKFDFVNRRGAQKTYRTCLSAMPTLA